MPSPFQHASVLFFLFLRLNVKDVLTTESTVQPVKYLCSLFPLIPVVFLLSAVEVQKDSVAGVIPPYPSPHNSLLLS